jgi:probable addiction module antidote protein
MATIQTYPWDAAGHLETKEDIAAYLEAALEDGDPSLVVAALGDIARSKGMTNIARETGLIDTEKSLNPYSAVVSS